MKSMIVCLCFLWTDVAISQDQPLTGDRAILTQVSVPLSQEQGEEILNELRLIRRALEDRRAGVVSPSPVAMPVQSTTLAIDPDWFALGSEHAPVIVVEFSDFQCPYCTSFNKETFPKLKEAYIDTGKVRFVSREYPLEGHANALNAALAARCAGVQGNYWQMRRSIIDGGPDLSPEAFDRYAARLALNVSRFRACLKDGLSIASIQRDKADGQSIGVTGTPAFFIGNARGRVIEGTRFDGAQPYAQFAAEIDAALRESRSVH